MCSWEVSSPEQRLSSLTLSFTSHQLSKQPLTSYKLSKRIIPLKNAFVYFFIVLYRIPRTIGVSIPMKATFFITYIMVDGWAGIAGEILRLKPLVIFHLKNMFIVKTDRDRERAMDPGFVDFKETLPSLQLYFLLGIVYAVVTPILLPFICVFFAFAYLVYRHQVRFTTQWHLILFFKFVMKKRLNYHSLIIYKCVKIIYYHLYNVRVFLKSG